MSSDTIAAVVVGYRPDLHLLDRLLAGLLLQADAVILVDNGGSRDYLAAKPELQSRVHYLPLGSNRGLGYALNAGFAWASEQGCEYVATFDQDSLPPDDMLLRLREMHCDLRSAGVACAAVGPCFHDHREESERPYPLYREQHGRIRPIDPETVTVPAQEVDTLITSGMLVTLVAWRSSLSYDPDFFVDYTDTDWCFRARAAGWHLYAHCGVRMGHALADSPPVRLLGLSFMRYSPLRRYYYFRNTLYFLRQTYVSRAWKRRLCLGVGLRLFINPWIDEQGGKSLYMSLSGLWDGLRGKGFRA